MVESGFYLDDGVKWGLSALEKAGITLYIPSSSESSYLQIATAWQINNQIKDMLVSADRARVSYKIVVNVDDFVDLGSAINGGKVACRIRL